MAIIPALTGHSSTALPTEVATYRNLPEGSSACELPPATKGTAPTAGIELLIAPVEKVIVPLLELLIVRLLKAEVDGSPVDHKAIPLRNDGGSHAVVITMGRR